MKYKVFCPEGFYDGNVLKQRVPMGGEVIVDEMTYKKMVQSDPTVQLVQVFIPKPTRVTNDQA